MRAFLRWLPALPILMGLTNCAHDPAELAQGYKVGLSKITATPEYNAGEKGIIDAFAGQKVKAVFDSQNANGSLPYAATIANRFNLQKKHIVIGISTPSALALSQTISELPVVFAAVSDPVAAQLVPSLTVGGNNVTGVTDMIPILWHIQLMRWIKPGIQKIGYIYAAGDASAAALARMARKIIKTANWQFVPLAVLNRAELETALPDFLSEIDMLYLPPDPVVAAAIKQISRQALAAALPVLAADLSRLGDNQVLLAWGFDYYRLGRAVGDLAIEILAGAKTANLPPRFLTNQAYADLAINLDVAKELGLSIPVGLLAGASLKIEDGKPRKP